MVAATPDRKVGLLRCGHLHVTWLMQLNQGRGHIRIFPDDQRPIGEAPADDDFRNLS
jgi:hypothetical protein